MKDQTTGSCKNTAAISSQVRNLLLPHLLVCPRVQRRDEAVLASPDYRDAASRAELSRGDADSKEEISRLWIVRSRRPIARGGGLRDVCIRPLRRKHAAALVSCYRFRALRSRGIANRDGLCGRRLLPRLLRNCFFLDRRQWLAGCAIQDIDPSLLGMCRQSFAHPATVHLIEQDHGSGHVEVPKIVMNRLIVPAVFTGQCIQGNDGVGE